MQELDRIPSHSLKGALEALLLVSTDAVPATEFARELGVAPSEAADALAELAAEYADTNRGFQLREVSGGWRLFTHPAMTRWSAMCAVGTRVASRRRRSRRWP